MFSAIGGYVLVAEDEIVLPPSEFLLLVELCSIVFYSYMLVGEIKMLLCNIFDLLQTIYFVDARQALFMSAIIVLDPVQLHNSHFL